ncbi:MAG: hypothetical protein J6333_01910 [Planctomycetes bacterium]|nr:hypothetical protein [Planctomycetota bacterium]
MKRLQARLTWAILLLAVLSAGSWAAEVAVPLPDADGKVTVGNLRFFLAHWDANWNLTAQDAKTVTPAAGFPKKNDRAYEFQGTWQTASGTMPLREKFSREANGTATMEITVDATGHSVPGQLAWTARLPHADYVGTPPTIDGAPAGFGAEFNDQKERLFFNHDPHTVELYMDTGSLVIRGEFAILLQDNRRYKQDYWECRFILPVKDAVPAKINLAMTFTPHRFTPVSLAAAANLDFRDEVPGDGKGGWSDQGADNDMRVFPVKQKQFARVPFAITDPATNNGKGCIGLFHASQTPSYPKQVAVAANGGHGNYLYLLHAFSWGPQKGQTIGDILVRYANGKEKSIPVVSGVDINNFWHPSAAANANLAWKGENASAPVGIYVSAFELENTPVREFLFRSRGNAIWLVAGATFADTRMPQPLPETDFKTHANADWLVIHNDKNVEPGSVLDLSSLMDAPAGKHGFVVSRNGRFEFAGRPGVPARFWGGNLAFEANFLEKPEADHFAETLARMGYNIVRLHHFDHIITVKKDKTSTSLNAAKMDQLDYLAAALLKRGIYLTIDLFIFRQLDMGEIEEFPERAMHLGNFKEMPFISESAMKSWMDFSRNFLEHVNPYTKRAWKDEPGLAFISLINEDAILGIAQRNDYTRALYEKKFAAYVQEKGIALTPANRKSHWERFLLDTYRVGYNRMAKFLRQLGVKALLSDQNHWNNSLPLMLTRTDYDYVDTHFYWQHPDFLGPNWQLPARVGNRSAVDAFGGALAEMFGCRIFGKPFTVTEWDYVNFGSAVAEGSLMTGAYAALQSWDALCRFNIAGSREEIVNNETPIGFFDIINDPVRALSERAGAVAFLRGDVAPAKEHYAIVLPTNHMERDHYLGLMPRVADRLGLVGKVGTVIAAPGSQLNLPANTRAVLSVETDWDAAKCGNLPTFKITSNAQSLDFLNHTAVFPKGCVDLQNQRFVSSTGELTMDKARGVFTAVTPRSEGIILPAGQKAAGKFIQAENGKAFSTLFAAAMDGQSLGASRRILLLHLTESKNSEQTFGASDYSLIKSWGQLPVLLKRGTVKVRIHAGKGGEWKLYHCRMTGRREGEIPLTRDGEWLQAELATPAMVYELTR